MAKLTEYDLTIVRWDFDSLFPGNLCVWGDFPLANTTRREKLCVGTFTVEATMNFTSPVRAYKGHRAVKVSMTESIFSKPGIRAAPIALNDFPNVRPQITGYDGATCVYWILEKDKNVEDGAVHIATSVFLGAVVRLEMAGRQHLNSSELVGCFSVRHRTVKLRRRRHPGDAGWRSEAYLLRQKHGFSLPKPITDQLD